MDRAQESEFVAVGKIMDNPMAPVIDGIQGVCPFDQVVSKQMLDKGLPKASDLMSEMRFCALPQRLDSCWSQSLFVYLSLVSRMVVPFIVSSPQFAPKLPALKKSSAAKSYIMDALPFFTIL